jgi:hypothetical protein
VRPDRRRRPRAPTAASSPRARTASVAPRGRATCRSPRSRVRGRSSEGRGNPCPRVRALRAARVGSPHGSGGRPHGATVPRAQAARGRSRNLGTDAESVGRRPPPPGSNPRCGPGGRRARSCRPPTAPRSRRRRRVAPAARPGSTPAWRPHALGDFNSDEVGSIPCRLDGPMHRTHSPASYGTGRALWDRLSSWRVYGRSMRSTHPRFV